MSTNDVQKGFTHIVLKTIKTLERSVEMCFKNYFVIPLMFHSYMIYSVFKNERILIFVTCVLTVHPF